MSLKQIYHFISLLLVLLFVTIHFSTSQYTLPSETPIIIQPYIIDYRNGTVTRYTTPQNTVPPPCDSHVHSKDVNISNNLRARVFIPTQLDPASKLPILLYFHGGAFCIGAPFAWGDSHYMANIVADAHVVAISVDYRLYPEFTIPAPYEDAWAALEWVAAHASYTEPGLDAWVAQYGDINRIFIGGDSAGGNIAHNLAFWVGLRSGPSIVGLFLAMPYFLGSDRVPLEPRWIPNSPNFRVWSYVCNNCTNGVDNLFMNPFGPGAPEITNLGIKKLLVYTAEVDELRGRGIWYYEKVSASGWPGQARWIEAPGKAHLFHIDEPDDQATSKLIHDLSAFINID